MTKDERQRRSRIIQIRKATKEAEDAAAIATDTKPKGRRVPVKDHQSPVENKKPRPRVVNDRGGEGNHNGFNRPTIDRR